MILDPTIPVEGGGMAGYPVSVTGRTTVRKSSWEIVKGRYGKPVLTPIWGMDVTVSEPTDVVKPQILAAVEGKTLQKGTILKASRPKNMNRDRSDELIQHRVQEDKRTIPNQVIGKERSEMTTAEYEMPIYGVETDGPWRTVIYNNRQLSTEAGRRLAARWADSAV